MKPTDFIEVARKLLEPGYSEAAARSAVSRAYYGAFHCCATCIPPDLQPDKDTLFESGSHKAVITSLESWGRSGRRGRTDAQIAARKLAKLRRSRNIADYKLAQQFPMSPQTSVEEAAEVAIIVERAQVSFLGT